MKNKYKKKNIFDVAGQALEQIKYEIAQEHGINLGPNTTSRQNGYVGGMMKKSLTQLGEIQMKDIRNKKNK